MLLIYMAHIPYENSQLFYDEQRARGKVTEFLPRFKMITSLGAVDKEGEESGAGQGRSKTGAASAYNILLLLFFFCRLALRISLFAWICLKISRCLPDLRTITVSGILSY